MLQVLLLLIATFITSLAFGGAFASISRIKCYNPIQYVFFGLFWLAILLRIYHFFLPINGAAFIFFLSTATFMLVFLYQKLFKVILLQILNIIITHYLLFLPIVVSTLYFTSLPSISYDEGLYHAGFIGWINKYPIVKGLANVQFRFGFNSNWHLIAALFNGYGLFHTICNSINSFLILSFILYFLHSPKPLHFYASAALFFPLLIIYHLIDPSADLAVCFFGFAFILHLFNTTTEETPNLFWLYALAFLFTVKVNAATLGLFGLIYCWQLYQARESIKLQWKAFLVFCFLLFGTWIISNVIIAGYLIFPYLNAPFIHPNWAIALLETKRILNLISYAPIVHWANISFEAASQLNKIQLAILWWHNVRLVEKSIFLLFLSSAASLVAIFNNDKRKQVLAICIFITLLVNLFLIPDLRFYAGIGLAGLVGVLSCIKIKINKTTTFIIGMVVLAQLFITVYLYQHLYPKLFNTTLSHSIPFVFKQPYQYGPIVQYKVDGLSVGIPLGSEFSWDITPTVIAKDTTLHLLGKDVKDGFYKKYSSQ